MTKKYYAVAVGKTPGIYFSWDDCKKQVNQFPGALYKSFKTIEEAEKFINTANKNVAEAGKRVVTHEESSEEQYDYKDVAAKETRTGKDGGSVDNDHVSTDTCLVAYVDGSYEHSRRRYAYGCVMVLQDELVKLNGDGNDEDYVSMRNVAGEILGSEQAVLWAVEHGYGEVIIYYDYEGIEKWADDIWKANKPGTIRYKQFVAEQRKRIKISFRKVAAHTGVTYNEMADKLAKEALGL